jgi:ATP-binding cassette subfamily F protein 1
MTTELRATTQAETWNPDAVSISGLSIAIGSKQLISGTDITIRRGDRLALLGRNGSGKTTLFRWIRERQPTNWRIYEVAQELSPTSESPVQVVLAAHLERGALWARQAALECKEEDLTDEELEEYTAIGEQLAAMNADADPPRARRILAGLGFSAATMDGPLTALSGGWRARVALAQGLFMEPELLLLDEPTNHLDLNGVIWLSTYLQGWRQTLIVISHNAGFVREVSTAQWLIRSGQVHAYKMRYDRYLREREMEEKKAARDWDALEKQVVTMRRKGTPAARKEADALIAKKAREGVTRPEKPYTPKFFFMEDEEAAASRPGALIACNEATLGYASKPNVLRDVTFALHDGCRVALVGANGSGKSTLLRFLTEGEGSAVVADGWVERKPRLCVCAFDQHFYHSLPGELTPLEYLTKLAPVGPAGEGTTKQAPVGALRQVLGATGLEGAAHTRPIATLSGGQKARVYFGGIAVQGPDVLLMDEPTNHLDMETVAGLATALRSFRGAAVIVSHDLDFLEEVATETWVVRDGRVERSGEGTDGLGAYVVAVAATIDA